MNALLVALVLCAPAPYQRPAKSQLPLRGEYTMEWGGHDWVATFSSDGSYVADHKGTKFFGTWCMDHEGFLVIRESSHPERGHFYEHKVRLCPFTLRGRTAVSAVKLWRNSK